MKRITFLTSAIGLCLAGYLVAVGMLDSSCAFEPVCEYFLGLPTYYYGFALFFAVVLVLLILRWRMVRVRTAEIIILAVSLLGIVFSGYYALRRMPAFFTTPAIGFLFFFVIFTITLVDSLAVRSDT